LNQSHDAQGRFASGDGSGGKVTNAVKETQALRALADARKFRPDRTSIRNIKPPVMYAGTVKPGQRGERVDLPAHSMGVHNATFAKSLPSNGGGGGGGGRFSGNPAKRGKTLAQLSAMGATTAVIKPPWSR
jgi:hypothetical protein